MTMAKGIANGLPLGALVTTAPIADSFEKSTLSTFGGNPVSCAAANAVLDVLEEEQLLERAAVMGERLREGLVRIRHRFPAIVGDIRGIGLMQAIEFVMDETAGDRTPNAELTSGFIEGARRNGLLLGRGGLYANVVRIAPPLTVSADEIDEALAAVENALVPLI